jgi:hypothetical protein
LKTRHKVGGFYVRNQAGTPCILAINKAGRDDYVIDAIHTNEMKVAMRVILNHNDLIDLINLLQRASQS